MQRTQARPAPLLFARAIVRVVDSKGVQPWFVAQNGCRLWPSAWF